MLRRAYIRRVPVEGQLHRIRTPLARRERLLLAAAVAAGVVAVVVATVVYATQSHVRGRGCVVFSVPSTMGGATLRECGPAARRFCRTQGTTNAQFAAACRSAGLAVRP
ncbi:MAG TPA: hypothetical protein VFA05_09350 [Gaiellaceae bacterium]|nr:hypothetical protein [Gaiellaceae bacterium]